MDDADAEIEALCSIWDGVEVSSPTSSERILKHKMKSLEDEVTSASIMLEIRVSAEYPAIPPQVTLSNPRGISERDFFELRQQIDVIIQKNSDEMPIICEIFQHCSDFLTENQHNNMDCSICLLCLSKSSIIATTCDHFMHSACFNRYLIESSKVIERNIQDAQPYFKKSVQTNILCPVCRSQLTENNDIYNYSQNIQKMIRKTTEVQKISRNKKRRSSSTEEDLQMAMMKWREEQRRFAKIYEEQKEKGGIIDVEEEKKRRQFYIEINDNVTDHVVRNEETAGTSQHSDDVLVG